MLRTPSAVDETLEERPQLRRDLGLAERDLRTPSSPLDGEVVLEAVGAGPVRARLARECGEIDGVEQARELARLVGTELSGVDRRP